MKIGNSMAGTALLERVESTARPLDELEERAWPRNFHAFGYPDGRMLASNKKFEVTLSPVSTAN